MRLVDRMHMQIPKVTTHLSSGIPVGLFAMLCSSASRYFGLHWAARVPREAMFFELAVHFLMAGLSIGPRNMKFAHMHTVYARKLIAVGEKL